MAQCGADASNKFYIDDIPQAMDVKDKALEVAVQAAKIAGELMVKGFHGIKNVDIKTAPHDLVTEYDKGVECILISEIKRAFPLHRFIGEETAHDIHLTDDPTWIIDPIDGTINYVHGFHESAISIGFAVNQEVIVGVIYNPILDHLFTACKGNGAFQNGKKIEVSTCTEHAKSLLAVEASFACVPSLRHKVIERLDGLIANARGIRSIGCAATTLAYVANGSLDAYVQDELQCWDVAAGVIIIKEAGGVVMSSDGQPFNLTRKKIMVAATEALADQLLLVVKNADKRASEKNGRYAN